MHSAKEIIQMDKSESVYELFDEFLRQEKLNEEAKEAHKYVTTRKLIRPKTTYWCVIFIFALYLILPFIVGFGIKKVFSFENNVWLIFLTTYLISSICFSNFLCIKVIECYQHYAKEETRRRCLCKPTCSEYAICVLKKYFIFIALYKIYKRLFKTCQGGFYKIDFP